MKKTIKLLVNEKFRLEEILETPMSILSDIGQEQNVSWKSFESKKTELESELLEITTALLVLDPEKKLH